MTNELVRADRALRKIWVKHERARWKYAVLGRRNGDLPIVGDSPDDVWVTMAENSTEAQVYNGGNGAVPLRWGLRVKIRDDAGRLIIEGQDTSRIMDGDSNAPGYVYSVNLISPDSHGDVTLDPDDLDDSVTAHKFTTAADIAKLAGIEALADVTGTAITALATKTTPVDADDIVITDSAASNAPKRVTGTNYKVYFKAYFDTLYQTLLSAISAKTTPVDADSVVILDSAASNVPKKVTGTNWKVYMKAYFDTLYNLYVHPNHTGDVTSVGDGATTIANDAVTNAKAANMATQTIKGRTTVGTGDPEDLTKAQTLTLLNVADGANAYVHPNHTGDVTSVGDGATTIAANAVTFAKMQDIATDSLIGRDTASTGDPENILLGASLSMDGSGNLQRAALTGDVTASANSNATAIGANKVLTAMIADAQVTLAKQANLAADTIIGRANAAGTGVPQALTAAQVVAILSTTLNATYLQFNASNYVGSAQLDAYLEDVADITTLQSLQIDVTNGIGSGNARTFITYIDFVGAKASTTGIYAWYQGWVAWNIDATTGTTHIRSYDVAHGTSGTDACLEPVAITGGVRFVVDSSAFGNTLDRNTLKVWQVENAAAITITTTIA